MLHILLQTTVPGIPLPNIGDKWTPTATLAFILLLIVVGGPGIIAIIQAWRASAKADIAQAKADDAKTTAVVADAKAESVKSTATVINDRAHDLAATNRQQQEVLNTLQQQSPPTGSGSGS